MPRYWDPEGRSYGGDGGGRFRTVGRFGLAGRPPKEYSYFRQKERQELENPFFPIFLVVMTIIDIIMFIYSIVKNGGFEPFSQNPMGGPSAQTLVDLGAKYGPCIQDGDWWRFFTPMWLHGGIIHILMNLYTQVRVGFALERAYGPLRIAPVYIGAGVMGNLLSAIFLPEIPSVGASSSLMGLVGLMLVDILVHWNSLSSPAGALCEYFCQLIITLLIGLLPIVDNFAHIGGYIGGLLIAIVFIPGTRRILPQREEPCCCPKVTCKLLAILIFAALTAVLYIVLFSVFYEGVDPDGWCENCRLIDCVEIMDWCDYQQQTYSC